MMDTSPLKTMAVGAVIAAIGLTGYNVAKPPNSPEVPMFDQVQITVPAIVEPSFAIAHEPLDRFCLAKNIYHEARGESIDGQYAVAQVTINRMFHDRWPSTVCEVVMEPYQFSWANDRSRRWTHPPANDPAWKLAKEIAYQFLVEGKRVEKLKTALFYHTDWVSPDWSDPKYQLAQIDSHVFFFNDVKR